MKAGIFATLLLFGSALYVLFIAFAIKSFNFDEAQEYRVETVTNTVYIVVEVREETLMGLMEEGR